MKILAFAAATMAACADGSDVDPTGLRSGIYELHAETRSDTCDPRRVSGDLGQVAVTVTSDHISTVAPLGSASSYALVSYELPASTGYRSYTGPGMDPSVPCGGHSMLLLTRDLVASSVQDMVVQEMASWTLTAPCTNDVQVDGLPTRTCHSDMEYTSTLVMPCETPCVVVAEASQGIQLRCVCPP